jgi:hypothetical protein
MKPEASESPKAIQAQRSTMKKLHVKTFFTPEQNLLIAHKERAKTADSPVIASSESGEKSIYRARLAHTWETTHRRNIHTHV